VNGSAFVQTKRWELEHEQGSEDAEAETDDTDSTPETE